MTFLLPFIFGILLVIGLHRMLGLYTRTSPRRLKALGTWSAGIALILASVFSPVLRRLALVALLIMPWRWYGGNSRLRPSHMSEEEAREILGVSKHAGRAEIEAGYRRLMRLGHPDHGGSDGIAKKLNEARDVLLKGKS